jgi:hypothetical protein
MSGLIHVQRAMCLPHRVFPILMATGIQRLRPTAKARRQKAQG